MQATGVQQGRGEDMTLAEYIDKEKTTAAEVARLSGVSAATISRHLAGLVRLSGGNAIRICEATGGECSLRDLLAPQCEEVKACPATGSRSTRPTGTTRSAPC